MNTLSACQFDMLLYMFRLSPRECDHPALLHFVWSPFTLSDIPFSCSSQAPEPDSVRQLEYQVNLACAGFPVPLSAVSVNLALYLSMISKEF